MVPNEESKENAQDNGAKFECNVCLETAKEPVVTPCGHLFCWPCLYLSLKVHSERKECPVCKGKIRLADITPIYGCGSSDSDGERANNTASVGKDGVKIPPRPHGNRVGSSREQQSSSRSSATRQLLGPSISRSRRQLAEYVNSLRPGRLIHHNRARTNADHNSAVPSITPRQLFRQSETTLAVTIFNMANETLAAAPFIANLSTSEQLINSAASSRNRMGRDGRARDRDSSDGELGRLLLRRRRLN